MMNHEEQLSAFVLAQVEWELAKISALQHSLARRRAHLRERAALLRLGASPAEPGLAGRPARGADRMTPMN
jgi:hypothetical protein